MLPECVWVCDCRVKLIDPALQQSWGRLLPALPLDSPLSTAARLQLASQFLCFENEPFLKKKKWLQDPFAAGGSWELVRGESCFHVGSRFSSRPWTWHLQYVLRCRPRFSPSFWLFFPAEQSGSSDIVTLCQIADVYQACDPNTEKKKPHESEVICAQTPLFSPPAY